MIHCSRVEGPPTHCPGYQFARGTISDVRGEPAPGMELHLNLWPRARNQRVTRNMQTSAFQDTTQTLKSQPTRSLTEGGYNLMMLMIPWVLVSRRFVDSQANGGRKFCS